MGWNLKSTLGIEGLLDADRQGRLAWLQTAENILTFGHLLCPAFGAAPQPFPKVPTTHSTALTTN